MNEPTANAPHRIGPDWPFTATFWIIGGVYLALIVAMVAADSAYTSPAHIARALSSPEIQYAIKLSMISCTISAVFSLIVAVPLGYLLSRHEFRGKSLVDTILDIPIVLPPLVIGLSLLILFQVKIAGQTLDDWLDLAGQRLYGSLGVQLNFRVTFAIPSVILAQFAVACAFAVRTMRVTFEQINPRNEQVALTLGCTRSQAFWRVLFPEARRGVLTAGTLAWARSLGEFGPILVFSGATPMKTEVLSTAVYLEISIGHLDAAVAVSLLMIAVALIVLLLVRFFGAEAAFGRAIRP